MCADCGRNWFVFHFFEPQRSVHQCLIYLNCLIFQRDFFNLWKGIESSQNAESAMYAVWQLPNVAPTSNMSLCLSSLHSVNSCDGEKSELFGGFTEVRANIFLFCNWCLYRVGDPTRMWHQERLWGRTPHGRWAEWRHQPIFRVS